MGEEGRGGASKVEIGSFRRGAPRRNMAIEEVSSEVTETQAETQTQRELIVSVIAISYDMIPQCMISYICIRTAVTNIIHTQS